MQSKACSRCRAELPIERFAADCRSKSRLQAACRECQRLLYNTPARKAAARRKTGDVSPERPYVTREESSRAAATKRQKRLEQRLERDRLALERTARPSVWTGCGSKSWYLTASAGDIAAYRDEFVRIYALRYARQTEQERERSKRYKHANPHKVAFWQGKRARLAAQTDDRTLTRETVGELFASARKCPYCGDNFSKSRKSLDHMTPISRGGIHSAANVLVCCLDCNTKKRDMPFEEWLKLLPKQHARRAARLLRTQSGSTPRQTTLLLSFSPR